MTEERRVNLLPDYIANVPAVGKEVSARIVKRAGNLAMYHRSDMVYEVFYVGYQNERTATINGREVYFKPMERYCYNAQFERGQALTANSLERAEKHFKKLSELHPEWIVDGNQ